MKYICSVCGYIYDEAREKVPFSELPDSWKCPVCKAAKSVFVPEKKKEEPKGCRFTRFRQWKLFQRMEIW